MNITVSNRFKKKVLFLIIQNQPISTKDIKSHFPSLAGKALAKLNGERLIIFDHSSKTWSARNV
jgi:hypothetical protein